MWTGGISWSLNLIWVDLILERTSWDLWQKWNSQLADKKGLWPWMSYLICRRSKLWQQKKILKIVLLGEGLTRRIKEIEILPTDSWCVGVIWRKLGESSVNLEVIYFEVRSQLDSIYCSGLSSAYKRRDFVWMVWCCFPVPLEFAVFS